MNQRAARRACLCNIIIGMDCSTCKRGGRLLSDQFRFALDVEQTSCVRRHRRKENHHRRRQDSGSNPLRGRFRIESVPSRPSGVVVVRCGHFYNVVVLGPGRIVAKAALFRRQN